MIAKSTRYCSHSRIANGHDMQDNSPLRSLTDGLPLELCI